MNTDNCGRTPNSTTSTPDDETVTPEETTTEETPKTQEEINEAATGYTDVATSDWHVASVAFVVEKGLFQGVSSNEFAPNSPMTRNMVMTVLQRLSGEEFEATDTQWYAAGMEWSMAKGISDGTNGDGQVTREQLATMLYRYAESIGMDMSASADLSSYGDAGNVSSYAQNAMTWCVANSLINGMGDNNLDAGGNATRAQVATILERFCNL